MGCDHRLAGRVMDLRLEADRGEVIGEQPGRSLGVASMGRVGAHAGNPQKRAEAIERLVELGINSLQDGRQRHTHQGSPRFDVTWSV